MELWVDRGYAFLQVFTGDTLAPARRRTGLALEPMTCAPNAFRSGEGLAVIEPGGSSLSLKEAWGSSASSAGCAHALVELAKERFEPEGKLLKDKRSGKSLEVDPA